MLADREIKNKRSTDMWYKNGQIVLLNTRIKNR